MRTVQLTLDEGLVKEVNELAKRLNTTRSAFTRDALRQAVDHQNLKDAEERHRQGCIAKPVTPEEFSVWEAEQAWGK